VISHLEGKASGRKLRKLLTKDEQRLYLLMLRPVQELLEQQKIKVSQLEAEIEGLRAREMQVSKAKLDKGVGSKRKRVTGE
ncbi:MAG: hypothetical protein M1813_002226, partial [Trichoglossum hirsutum]